MKNVDQPDQSRNPDPLSGAPGFHPVGTGLGAVAGGAAAGAAIGTVAGPIGTAAGAAVGAIVGGLAGKSIAEKVNPTVEDAYWRKHHATQPYAQGSAYEIYHPAYRIGYEGYAEMAASGATFETFEPVLRQRYEGEGTVMPWEKARPATRAAWDRLGKRGASSMNPDL